MSPSYPPDRLVCMIRVMGKTSARSEPLRVEVFSDFICPWCYIGVHRLDVARAREDAPPIEILWRPFELNPDMPVGGMDRQEYRSAKFGSWERSRHLDAGTEDAGRPDGLTFRYDLMRRTPNTFDAHRVVAMAGEQGLADAMVRRLLRAYFVEGYDIGDHRALAGLAADVGLDPEVVTSGLAGDAQRAPVRQQLARGRQIGISGVPAFVAGGQYAVTGAQPDDVLIEFFRRYTETA